MTVSCAPLLGLGHGHQSGSAGDRRCRNRRLCSPESVWRLLVDVENWPTWNPDIKAVRTEGALAEGNRFRWKAGLGWISSTIRKVEPPHVLGWTGTTFSIKAAHVYRLTPIDGGTRVHTEESWEGFLARRPQGLLQQATSAKTRFGPRSPKTGCPGGPKLTALRPPPPAGPWRHSGSV